MAAKAAEVSAKDRDLNYAELDEIALTSGLIDSSYNRVLPEAYLKDLKIAMGILARYGKKVLVTEIVAAEITNELRFRSQWDSVQIIMAELYSFWVDKDAIVGRVDNLLAVPDTRIGWEDEFARGAARTICEGRFVVTSDDKSFEFGYMDGKEIVAAFDVREETWYDEGFGERDVEYSGFVADVMLSNGVFAKARFEGSISELMMAILSRALRK